jgi:hypothetical protein
MGVWKKLPLVTWREEGAWQKILQSGENVILLNDENFTAQVF